MRMLIKSYSINRALLLIQYRKSAPYYYKNIATNPSYLLSNLDRALIAILDTNNPFYLPAVYALLIEFLINDEKR